jgi:hypothetical protein
MPCLKIDKPKIMDYFLKTDEQIMQQIFDNITEELPQGLTTDDLPEELAPFSHFSEDNSTVLW